MHEPLAGRAVVEAQNEQDGCKALPRYLRDETDIVPSHLFPSEEVERNQGVQWNTLTTELADHSGEGEEQVARNGVDGARNTVIV